MTFVEPKAHRSSSFDFQPLARSNTYAPGSKVDFSHVESMSFENGFFRGVINAEEGVGGQSSKYVT